MIEKFKTMLFGDKLKELREYQNHYNYQRAMELLNQDRNQAMELLKKEVSEYPENGYAHYWIGRLFYDNGQWGATLMAANNAIKYLAVDKNWMNAAHILRAKVNRELGNEKDMLADYANAITCNPENTVAYEDRADYYYSKKMYDESDQDYSRFVELDPGNPFGFAGLGRNAMERGDLDLAIAKFEYALKLDSGYACAYSFLADCKLPQGDVVGCIKDCIECLSLDPENRKAHYLLLQGIEPGEISEDLGMVNENFALIFSYLTLQAQKDPNNSIWPFLMGMKHSMLEEHYDAISSFREANNITPCALFQNKIAQAYVAVGDYRRAEVYFRKAVEFAEDDFQIHKDLALSLFSQTRIEEAVCEFEKCNAMQPENVRVLIYLSSACRMAKRFDDAERYARMAVSLAPDDSECWLKLANAAMMAGKKELQEECLNKIISMDNPAPLNKSIALALSGRADEAWEIVREPWEMSCNSEYILYCGKKAYVAAIIGKLDEARDALIESLDSGYRDFEPLLHNDLYQCFRQIPDFEDLIANYRNQVLLEFFEENEKIFKDGEDEGSDSIIAVPFTSDRGMCKVRGEVNGLPLNFVFDTGASDVTISMVEANFMLKNGYLEERDFGGTVNYRTASGDVREGTVITLREVRVGQLVIPKVRATVVNSQNAPLLLGQSVLGRYAKVEVDNESMVIRFTFVMQKTNPDEFAAGAASEVVKGNYKGAAQLYRVAYEGSRDPSHIFFETVCWLWYGAFDKCHEVAREFLETFPDNADAHNMYAQSLYYLGDYEGAINAYRDNVKTNPEDPQNWNMLCYSLVRDGQYEKAVKFAEEALAVHPDYAPVIQQRAIALERLGRKDEAVKDFERVAVEPLDVDHGMIAAEALLHLGRKDECIENIKSSLQDVDEQLPVTVFMLKIDAAEYYAEMGNQEEALRLFQQCLENPTRCYYGVIRRQFDYEALRALPGFEETMQRYESALAVDLAEL